MKERILKYAIYVTGFICLYVFISVRILPLYNVIIVEKMIPDYWDLTKYGELYYFNYIKHFREQNLPEAVTKHQLSEKQSDVNQTEIFTFGDSFFDISRGSQYPSALAQQLNSKVHFGYFDYPLIYLKKHGYKKADEKLLIMGIVERYIPVKFSKPHDTIIVPKKQYTGLALWAYNLKNFIFYKEGEIKYDALLKRSYLTTAIYSEIATLKFNVFGFITKFTPVYNLNDTIPWLYIDDEVDGNNTSFFYRHSEEEMENISNNIEDLALKLKKLYNINLVFIPIPAKFTLYHQNLTTEKYNNFIPRLQQKLAERHVNFIDLYSEFSKSDELLYYGTDAHWNERGLQKAVNITVNSLSKSNYKFNLYNESSNISGRIWYPH